MKPIGTMLDLPLPEDLRFSPAGETPLFVGHYWLTGTPERKSAKVACLDYSAVHEGSLVAYRWDGEPDIDNERFVQAG